MRLWLRTYKMVDGKGENQLAYGGIVLVVFSILIFQPFQERDAWEMVIEPNHKEWEKLIRGEIDKGSSCLDRKYKYIVCLNIY